MDIPPRNPDMALVEVLLVVVQVHKVLLIQLQPVPGSGFLELLQEQVVTASVYGATHPEEPPTMVYSDQPLEEPAAMLSMDQIRIWQAMPVILMDEDILKKSYEPIKI